VVLCITSIFVLLWISHINSENQIHKPIIIRTEKSANNEKPKATSVLLVKASNTSIHNAITMLTEFDKQFNLKYQYPITVFHEESFDSTYQERLQSAVKSVKVDFALVKFETPKWIDPSTIPKTFKGWLKRHTSIGYRHMCRFFSGEVFKHPALAKYDYYWRLDDDSQYLTEVETDPFEYMQQHGKVYGWNIWMYESQPIAGTTLWTTTHKYLKEKSIIPSPEFKNIETLSGGYNRCHYWNNFELVDLNFFRSQAYMDYYDYLDKVGGFYLYRWGDALVRTVALKFLVNETDVHYFDDIGYKHQGMCSLPDESGISPKKLECYDVHPADGYHHSCRFVESHFRGIETVHVIILVVGAVFVAGYYKFRKNRTTVSYGV